jgi:hypothetical protein
VNVGIKKFSVDMDIKNKGIELEVRSPGDDHQGDLIVTKTGLIWCNGKQPRRNGKKVSWDDFITWMNS